MAEKCLLDLSLLLPGVPDEQDACIGRLTDLLQAEGLQKAHLVREDGAARGGLMIRVARRWKISGPC
mgnify:FL=1